MIRPLSLPRFLLAGVLVSCVGWAPAARAGSSSPAAAPTANAKPGPAGKPGLTGAAKRAQVVKVGIYVHHIPELDVKTNSYVADFYLWFTWKGEIVPTRSFEFTNVVGSGELVKTPVYVDEAGAEKPDTLADGSAYQVYHVQGRFGNGFHLNDYPFDEQDMVLEIEDAKHLTDELVYEPDQAGSGYHPGLSIPGWRVTRVKTEVSSSHFDTNFGDPRVKAGGDEYSHLRYAIHVARPVAGLFAKTVIPIGIVILITFCAFAIDPLYIDARLALTITALISAVALQFTAAAELPSVGYIVLLDKIFILSYAVILLANMAAILSHRLKERQDTPGALRLDKISAAALTVVFFGGTLMIVWLR